MRIGVDFDNTIISYDREFHRAARERGLVAPDVPATKADVRDSLRRQGQENAWTELQGYVYGVAIADAPPFPGVLDFFSRCRSQKISVFLISHKTRFPVLGPQWDLHQSARNWLDAQGLLDSATMELSEECICFEETRQRKLDRIAEVGCTHFIDDLPEFLAEVNFPKGVERILFDPHERCRNEIGFRRASSWQEVIETLGIG